MNFLFAFLLALSLDKAAALHLVGDHAGAARYLESSREESCEASAAYAKALALSGAEKKSIAAYQKHLATYGADSDLLEEVCWAVLRKGDSASGLSTRVATLVGVTLTQDVRAVALLERAMSSSNYLMRAIGVELASMLRDKALMERVQQMVGCEPILAVRLAAIRAAGTSQIVELKSYLEEVVASKRVSDEEKAVAIEAIVDMTEAASPRDLATLLTSPRAGLRRLGCEVIGQLDLQTQVGLVEPLLADARPDVRLSALTTLGLCRTPCPAAAALHADPDRSVRLTAGWFTALTNSEEGLEVIRRELASPNVSDARLASAALRATGRYGVALASDLVATHPDPYVRANLALALIDQRLQVGLAADVLYDFLASEEGRIMWDDQAHPRFRSLAPTKVRHSPTIPNAPEVVNQLTRLDLLGTLAIVRHPKAQEALRSFLSQRSWGVSGMAAITLLEEGSEVAIDLVRHLLDDEEDQIRVQAALCLAIWGKDPTAIPTLIAAYDQADRDLKIKILESLGHVADRQALPFLTQVLLEPFQLIRVIAASSIIQTING